MDRRQFVRLVGGGVVLAAGTTGLAGCSSSYPKEALGAWAGPGGEADPRKRAVAYAITAPNPHNRQAWLVDLREANSITLYCDRERLLADSDPFGRQVLVGHGCFLELLVQALGEQGLVGDVQLWPQGDMPVQLRDWDQRPVARVVLRSGRQTDPLFAQVLKRRTEKGLYDLKRPVPDTTLQALLTSVSQLPVQVQGTLAGPQVQALRELAWDAAMRDKSVERVAIETLRLLRVGPKEIAQHRDGVAANNFMARFADTFGMLDRNKIPPEGSPADKQMKEMYHGYTRTAMGWVWLSTAGNTRTQQVQAGRAFVRLQLKATELGLGCHPLSQALQEYPEMAPFYDKAHRLLLGKSAPASSADATVQMLCRIGFLTDSAQATPRRPLEAFLQA